MLSKDIVGIKYPIQLDEKGDIASSKGLDLEKGDLLLLLGIERGEIPWDSELGTKIRELLHEHFSSVVTARAIAFRESTDQVNTYAPAYRIVSADVLYETNTVMVSIRYVVRDKVDEGTRTVTFEVNR